MLEDLCEKLHKYVNQLPRYDYSVKKEEIKSEENFTEVKKEVIKTIHLSIFA